MRCDKCGKEHDLQTLRKTKYICSGCNKYLRIPSRERIDLFTDKDSFEEWFTDIKPQNVLEFEGYEEKLKQASEKLGIDDAVVVGKATVFGEKIAIGVCDSRFFMGSMGYVVGEKVTRLLERATEERLPVFMFCCSGGARMQEGIVSLMQMEKTAAAVAKHGQATNDNKKGLLFCTILTDPTMGGMTASFAMLGDVIMAEPGAMIGFAGQRVIKQTIGKDLPEGFQTAEFQVEHGMIDGIIERKRIKKMMQFMTIANQNNDGYTNYRKSKKLNFARLISGTGLSNSAIKKTAKSEKTAWNKVKDIRKMSHPSTLDYISSMFDVFVELKGDRCFGDDKALVGGIAMLNGQPITVIAEDRGKTFKESIEKNFGMPNPEGYRKALRLMKQAEKFNRPIISFINTTGAYCGIEAEERGQGEAIARNLLEMSTLKVPVLAIIVGEAGSGGALATAVGNEVWMFENAVYSILTPEGYASILWKDSSRAEEAATAMKMEAKDMKKLGIIEEIVPEFEGASDENVEKISDNLRIMIEKFLGKYDKKTSDEIVEERYNRFRNL